MPAAIWWYNHRYCFTRLWIYSYFQYHCAGLSLYYTPASTAMNCKHVGRLDNVKITILSFLITHLILKSGCEFQVSPNIRPDKEELREDCETLMQSTADHWAVTRSRALFAILTQCAFAHAGSQINRPWISSLLPSLIVAWIWIPNFLSFWRCFSGYEMESSRYANVFYRSIIDKLTCPHNEPWTMRYVVNK